MKNYLYNLVAAAAISGVFHSCADDVNSSVPSLPVRIESLGIDGTNNARTVLDDTGEVAWKEGDQVKVTYNSTSTVTFTYSTNNTWEQEGTTLLAKDVTGIVSIESWGGLVTGITDPKTDQSANDGLDYLHSDKLIAIPAPDDNKTLDSGELMYDDQTGAISAKLAHAYTDVVINITEGGTDIDTLPEDVTMTLTVDEKTNYTMYKEPSTTTASTSSQKVTTFRAIVDLNAYTSSNAPTIKAQLSDNLGTLTFTTDIQTDEVFANRRITVNTTYTLQKLAFSDIEIGSFEDYNNDGIDITVGKE